MTAPPLRGGGGHQVSSPMAEYQSRLSSAPTGAITGSDEGRKHKHTHTTHKHQRPF